MPHKKAQPKPARLKTKTAPARSAPPPTVSGRWLLTAASIAIVAAAACAWLTLCLLFWQGSWQLLYHPTAAVTGTPASVGLAFDPVGFAATDAGEPRLKGWWIPAEPASPNSRFTVLYLHGPIGNLSNTVDQLAQLHAVGLNILAVDYRGYGQSQFAHPSEAHWREDAEWALQYLTATRHVSAGSIVLCGNSLGANLAFEVAASHPELAGVVLQSPLDSPVDALFSDPRAHLVPAHLLVRDRFNADKAAAALLIPSLWVMSPTAPDKPESARPTSNNKAAGQPQSPVGYNHITARKALVWLQPGLNESGLNEFGINSNQPFAEPLRRFLDDLPSHTSTP